MTRFGKFLANRLSVTLADTPLPLEVRTRMEAVYWLLQHGGNTEAAYRLGFARWLYVTGRMHD